MGTPIEKASNDYVHPVAFPDLSVGISRFIGKVRSQDMIYLQIMSKPKLRGGYSRYPG